MSMDQLLINVTKYIDPPARAAFFIALSIEIVALHLSGLPLPFDLGTPGISGISYIMHEIG